MKPSGLAQPDEAKSAPAGTPPAGPTPLPATALAFLADVTAAFLGSLDFEVTAQLAVEAAVPFLADRCALDLIVDGRLVRVAAACVDPAKIPLALELGRYAP